MGKNKPHNLDDLDRLLGEDLEEPLDVGEEKEDEEEDIEDVLAFMDNLVKKDKKENVKRSKKALEDWNEPVPFTQKWYEESISIRLRYQVCQCGEGYKYVEGIFLKSITKNGAEKWTRIEEGGILSHKNLPKEYTIVAEDIAHCPECFLKGEGEEK